MRPVDKSPYLDEASLSHIHTPICQDHLTQNQIEAYCSRAKMIFDNMRKCHSGADVHEVGNIRNTATLLIQNLRSDHGMCRIMADDIIRRLERKCIDFFTKKYNQIHGRQSKGQQSS